MTNDRPTYKPCPCGCHARIRARLEVHNALTRRQAAPVWVLLGVTALVIAAAGVLAAL
jgi:hypothetical protein